MPNEEEAPPLRVLSIGAHPDDCEFQTGGIAARYRALGHRVRFVSATNGNAGHHEKGGAPLAAIRVEEARQAAAVAGVESLVLDNDDGQLVADLAARETIIRLIRDYQPDIIFTHRPNDYHPDHRATGLLVQDASYLVRVPNICPLTPPLRYSPIIAYMHDGFQKPAPFVPSVVVAIDDVQDTKTRMIACHRSQVFEWLPWTVDQLDQVPAGESERFAWLAERQQRRDRAVADRFRDQLIARYGPETGRAVRFAEAFEISEYGRGVPDADRATYFPL